MPREVRLTKGKVAIVDDADYERVIEAGKWCMNGRYAYNAKHGTMHRFLLGLPIMRDRRVQVDHVNNDPLDNQQSNLRVCNPAQNQQNRHSKALGHSRFKGAHWDKSAGHWMARIRVDGKLKYLGLYETDLEAAQAYNEAASEWFGDFAALNDLEGAAPSPMRSRPKDQAKVRRRLPKAA